MVVIADSDSLIGLLNSEDAHYQTAASIMQELIKQEARIIYPVTVIAESATILQARLKRKNLAKLIINLVLEDKFIIEPVDEKMLQQATSLLDPVKDSSHNTLFDAIVATVAKKHKTKLIFSFDKWYEKLGFKLASSLI